MEEFELIAKTFRGLEEVLAEELTQLGANNVQIGHRMVSFTGDKALMYRANFCLRTAVRILKPIKHFSAKDADDVYNAVRQIDWSRYLDTQTSFAVDSVVNSAEFRHSKFVAYKVKDAIVDYFRDTTGDRPTIRITNPDLKLNIHISDDDCTLSLDSSGESLHLRGYRTATVEAPLNEVLAAGLIKLSGWKADCDFIDPFCGSGTLLVEAALMARGIAPGIFRKEFGFERWKDFDRELLNEIYNDDSQEREFPHHIYGYDINIPAIEAAAANAKSAGVANFITLTQRDIRQFTKPAEKAIIVTNPPYGERLTPPDLINVYQSFGKVLKHEFTGGEAWIISSKQELFENLGLRPSFKVQLLNGAIDCDFRKYQLFDGKMGAFRAKGGEIKSDDERRLMSDRRRFRTNREDFKKRITDEPEASDFDEEETEQMRILRHKHREFEDTMLKRRTPAPRQHRDGEHHPAKGKDKKPKGAFHGSPKGKPEGGKGKFGDAKKKNFRKGNKF